MSKQTKVLTILIGVLIVMIGAIANDTAVASSLFGPSGAYNVLTTEGVELEDSTIEGRIATEGSISTDGEDQIANGYDNDNIGYNLSSEEYPSVVAKDINNVESVTDGEIVTAFSVLSEESKNNNSDIVSDASEVGSDSSIDEVTENDIEDGLNQLIKGYESIYDEYLDLNQDKSDPIVSDYEGYYTTSDKSLLLIDIAKEDIKRTELENNSEIDSKQVDEMMSEWESEINSLEEGSEVELDEEAKVSLDVSSENISLLQDHEKLIIRSDVDIVNFDDITMTYDGSEIDLEEAESDEIDFLANNIVWVFSEATEINIKDSILFGSIMAPNANITIQNSTLLGQLYSNSLLMESSNITNHIQFGHEYDFDREIEYADITLNYIDEDGEQLEDSKNYKREIGTTFVSEMPSIEGYQLTSETSEVISEGLEVSEDSAVDIEYYATDVVTLTVEHNLEDGTSITDPIVTEYEIDSEYTTNSLEDVAYKLLETPSNSTGTITENTTVTYVYENNEDVFDVNITHTLANGKQVYDPETTTVMAGAEYDLSSFIKNDSSYSYVEVSSDSSPITGTANENLNINLIYESAVCSNLTSTEKTQSEFELTNYSQAESTELEYNQISGNYLIDQLPQTVEDQAYSFGNGYSIEDSQAMYDIRYSLDTSSNYEQFIPITTSGSYEPINIVISDNGNSYDVRSRNSANTINDLSNNKLGYQTMLASENNSSMLISFNQCDVTISYTNSNNNTTVIDTISYSELTNSSEQIAGINFSWDENNGELTFTIIYENNGVLFNSTNEFTVDFSKYSLNPQDYTVFTTDTNDSNITVFAPYTTVDRHQVEITATNSPYVNTKNSGCWRRCEEYDRSDAISDNEVYLAYYKNGMLADSKNRTSTSYISNNSLYYNPENYASLPTGSYWSSSNLSTNVYGYMVEDAYSPSGTDLNLTVENQAIYGYNDQPNNSMSNDNINLNMYEYEFDNLLDIPEFDPTTYINENGDLIDYDEENQDSEGNEIYDNVTYHLIDDSDVNYGTAGTYTAYAYSKTRNSTTGEIITGLLKINLTISRATFDFGDAPQSYGRGGTEVGNSSNKFYIGINRSGQNTYADTEAKPQYSEDAKGDDKLGKSDEDGWFNLEPQGIGELNLQMTEMDLSFPYIACYKRDRSCSSNSSYATVAFWIDYDQNGKFDEYEGYTKTVSRSDYDEYGMVNFNINVNPEFSTLESGDTTYARVRIVQGSNSINTSQAATDLEKYGETEDFKIRVYGKENEAQICTSLIADTPMLTIKDVRSARSSEIDYKNESGITYTFDIGSKDSGADYYPNVTMTITSKQGIASNTNKGEPAFFKVAKDQSPYESPANTIHIKIRDEDGEPLNLPLTFTFWDLDDFTNSSVVESASIYKDSVYLEGLDIENIARTFDSVGAIEDYDSYLKLFTTKQVDSEPSAAFYLSGDSLSLSDVEIVEEARLLEIGMGLDLSEMTKLITECIEPFDPLAQIQIFDNFYGAPDENGETEDVPIYNSYPFTYQSTNIAMPYFPNFNSVTQNLYIPEGVEFVDSDADGEVEDAVTIYRRDFNGSRTEDDWELVDSSMYTQSWAESNTKVSVTFLNPVENNLYGYEYRMQYNFQISEEMETGQHVTFKSDVVFNKGKTGEYTETYVLNDVTAVVREAFTLDMNALMDDEVITYATDSDVLSYTYEYNNCSIEASNRKEGDENYIPCYDEDNDEEPSLMPLLAADIDNETRIMGIPIADECDLSYANCDEDGNRTDSTDNFDRYEDITVSIYDNKMKVFEIPLKRWYNPEFEYGDFNLDDEDSKYASITSLFSDDVILDRIKWNPASEETEDSEETKDNGELVINLTKSELDEGTWEDAELLATAVEMINEQTVPVGQDIAIVAGCIDKNIAHLCPRNEEDMMNINYNRETINLVKETDSTSIIGGLFTPSDYSISISTEPTETVPTAWTDGSEGDFTVNANELVTFDKLKKTYQEEDKYHIVSLPTDLLDNSLETSKTTVEYDALTLDEEDNYTSETISDEYGQIFFEEGYEVVENDDSYSLSLSPELDDRYVIEKYSGRVYNNEILDELKTDTCGYASIINDISKDIGFEIELNSEVNCYHLDVDAETLAANIQSDYAWLQQDYNDVYSDMAFALNNGEGEYTGGGAYVLLGYKDPEEKEATIDEDGNIVYERNDITISDSLPTSFPLNTTNNLGEDTTYQIELVDMGLSNISIKIVDDLTVDTTELGYYQESSEYYFKRSTLSKEEEQCIKDPEYDCSIEFVCVSNDLDTKRSDECTQTSIAGTVENTQAEQHKYIENPNLLESFKYYIKNNPFTS